MSKSKWTDEQISDVISEVETGNHVPFDVSALASLVLDARAALVCDGCLGRGGHEAQGCACGGTGMLADMLTGARLALFEMKARAEKAEAERDAARAALSDAGVGGIDHHCGKGGGA